MGQTGAKPSAGKVLIVEDDTEIRTAVSDILRESGYEADEAENGLVAFTKLKAAEALPDLILLDLMMPVMSGAELVLELAKDSRLRLVPVVVLSAHLGSFPGRDSFHCIAKPFSMDSLLEIVARYCRAS